MYVDNHQHFDAKNPRGARRLLVLSLGFVLVGYLVFRLGGYHAAFAEANALGVLLPTTLWQALTLTGDAMTLCALLLLGARRYPQLAWASTLGLLISLLLVRGAKLLASAPRPPAELPPDSFFHTGPVWMANSFPSGHTLAAALVASVWVYHSRKTWPLIPSVLFIGAIGLSRVVVGVHWPVDTFFGAALGVFSGWLGTVAARHWTWGLRRTGHTILLILLTLATSGLFVVDGGYTEGIGVVRVLAGMAVIVGLRRLLTSPHSVLATRLRPRLSASPLAWVRG